MPRPLPLLLCACLTLLLLAPSSPAAPKDPEPVARAPGSSDILGMDRLAAAVSDAKLVWGGESHDNPEHHALQLAVLKALRATGRPLAVGLEMMRRDSQPELDAWVAGKTDEARMQAVFADNWGLSWQLYRDIFVFCRDQGVPMLGLNVPKGLTRKVAREGFASLTTEELGLLPPLTCDVSPAYRDFLSRLAREGHAPAAPDPHGDSPGFERFCEAQSVWDAALAAHALDYLGHHPDARVLILCGGVHAWKPAGPARAGQQRPGVVQAVLQPDNGPAGAMDRVSPADADFLLSFAR